jgi:hypothetical protein
MPSVPMRQFMRACLWISFVGVLSEACCPGSCSGKGTCGPNCLCECQNGFKGGNCAELTCPSSYAWSDRARSADNAHNEAECSNMGVCEPETGLCVCELSFSGLACQRKKCPEDCSGHGQCLSMMLYANLKDPYEGRTRQGLPTLGKALG